MVFELPRGTRDFSPSEMQKRRFLEQQLRLVFESYGYQEIQTPIFEHVNLFTEKSGDQILDELYAFKDKGGRDLALRPELTAPVIRFYVNKMQMEPKPLKLFYFGNCFRYDRPQKGRYREFMQAGCELIGTDNAEAIAELISMAYGLLHHVGLKHIHLQLGSLTVLKEIFRSFSISDEIRSVLIPLIDKEEFDEIESVLVSEGFDAETIDDFLFILQSSDIKDVQSRISLLKKDADSFSQLIDVMCLLQDVFEIDQAELNLGIVRGLDYYTGIVFEIKAPKLGAEKQICGGGQYQLIPLFGGRETPTAGFALGFDRTLLALEHENITFPKQHLDFFIIPVSDDLLADAFDICQLLRRKSYRVDVDLKRRGVGKALKYASARNTKQAIIIGPDEKNQNSLTIRDMHSGSQDLIKQEAFFNNLS